MPAPKGKYVDVSGAFDNCFFHAYAAHLLEHKLPFPPDLFTFNSILGKKSPASQLNKCFQGMQEPLSLFAFYSEIKKSNENPIAPDFVFEKTLVLGILLREWFATKMEKNPYYRRQLQNTVLKNIADGLPLDALENGPGGAFIEANRPFLNYYYDRRSGAQIPPTEQNKKFSTYFSGGRSEKQGLDAYLEAEGYNAYCRHLGAPNTKLSADDVMPIMQSLQQSVVIWESADYLVQELDLENQTPPMILKLDSAEGHYYLFNPKNTQGLLDQYVVSKNQYDVDREEALKMTTPKAKLEAANRRPSLLVAATCPQRHLAKEPLSILLEKVNNMRQEVNRKHMGQILKSLHEDSESMASPATGKK